jgi:hypothetical protein
MITLFSLDARHSYVVYSLPTLSISCTHPSLPFSFPILTRSHTSPSLDFILTFVSVMFNYAGPFFLKFVFSFSFFSTPHPDLTHIPPRRILDAIDLKHPTPSSKAKSYIYAFLAFTCTLLKVRFSPFSPLPHHYHPNQHLTYQCNRHKQTPSTSGSAGGRVPGSGAS